MPLVNIQVIENVYSPEQKEQLVTKITEALFAIKGEAIRGVTWIKIDEIKEGNWTIAGQMLSPRDIERMQDAVN